MSNRFSKFTLLMLTAGVTAMSSSAFAQQAPASADAGRTDRAIRERITVPSVSPDIQVRDIATHRAPSGAENVTFKLNSISLEGVTAYNQATLQKVYADKIGQTVSLADLYGIAADLTAKYRNDGYILTQIIVPPQTIDGGNARLQVVEGYIDQVTVKGDDAKESKALVLMRRYANEISKNGKALNTRDLERALLLINDLPGVSARSVIAPSASKTGAADLTIMIERDPYDAFLGIDNYSSRFLGRWEAMAGGSVNSQLFHNNERLSAQVVYAPHGPITDHELAYISGSYWTPIGGYGTNLEVLYSYTDTEPGLDLREFDVEGKSKYLSLTVKHPFIRSRDLNLTGRILLDGRNASNTNNIPDDREDNIRALRIGGRLEFVDTLFSGGVNTLDIEAARGLDIFGASDKGDAQLTRADGDPEFFKLEAELQRLQRLGQQFNILMGVKGQSSNDALLSSEEFGFGGSSYGRGYDPSEIVGDDGVAGKVELQWNPAYQSTWMNNTQVFGFWDIGKVWNDNAVTNSVESAASVGVGFRADFQYDIGTEFYVAVPLTHDVEAERDDDARFYLSVMKRF
jgi:hemolysin activation/secretion protein